MRARMRAKYFDIEDFIGQLCTNFLTHRSSRNADAKTRDNPGRIIVMSGLSGFFVNIKRKIIRKL